MSTDFNPTHRTNRAIGNIKAGSPIRVARYDSRGYFSDLLGQLGVKNDHIEYRYFENDVQFWDPRDLDRTSRYVLPDDYVITDGEHFEVSGTDFGWDLLPDRNVIGTEEVNISSHETYYCLYGGETGRVLRLTPDQLRDLSAKIERALPEPSPTEPEGVYLVPWDYNLYNLRGNSGAEIKLDASQLYDLVQAIQDLVPEPSPIENARFITAFHPIKGEYHVLAKIDGLWCGTDEAQYTEEQVLETFDEIEVIR